MLDYYGTQLITGKPTGNDFKDKKITLPLIAAFTKAEEKEIKKIKKMLKKGVSGKEIKYIINFVEQYGGIEYATHKQNEYAEKAKKCLDTYPNSEVKSAMVSFVDFTINRSK